MAHRRAVVPIAPNLLVLVVLLHHGEPPTVRAVRGVVKQVVPERLLGRQRVQRLQVIDERVLPLNAMTSSREERTSAEAEAEAPAPLF